MLRSPQASAIEWLGIGITPATYDDGINLAKGDRPDILADPRTRQAIALCMDRQKVVDTVLFGQSTVPLSFVPTGHPLYDGSVTAYQYDPAAALQLLERGRLERHRRESRHATLGCLGEGMWRRARP